MKWILQTLLITAFEMVKTFVRVGDDTVNRELQSLPGGCANFLISGYDIESPSSIAFYTPETFITLAQAGTYTGPDAVFEYVGFASPASPFFESDDVVLSVSGFAGYGADPKTDDPTELCQFRVGFLSES